jgi:hypothetical protein
MMRIRIPLPKMMKILIHSTDHPVANNNNFQCCGLRVIYADPTIKFIPDLSLVPRKSENIAGFLN